MLHLLVFYGSRSLHTPLRSITLQYLVYLVLLFIISNIHVIVHPYKHPLTYYTLLLWQFCHNVFVTICSELQ